MDLEKKVEVFKPVLNKFETNKMRLYCEDMIRLMYDYIFYMPSSTTGKFHNKTQCQTHGQIYHVLMFAEILNYILDLKYSQEKFNSPIQRDAMRCAALFHDSWKCNDGSSQYTVFDHPMLAGQWVRETHVEHDIDDKVKEAIARMCERHSGEFSTSKKSKIVLPEPENDMEWLIHVCDILSSRSNIDMEIPLYLSDIFKDAPIEFDPEYIMPFGKYAGKKLIDIYNSRPDYVEWMENNINKIDVLNAIKAMKAYVKNTKEDS